MIGAFVLLPWSLVSSWRQVMLPLVRLRTSPIFSWRWMACLRWSFASCTKGKLSMLLISFHSSRISSAEGAFSSHECCLFICFFFRKTLYGVKNCFLFCHNWRLSCLCLFETFSCWFPCVSKYPWRSCLRLFCPNPTHEQAGKQKEACAKIVST